VIHTITVSIELDIDVDVEWEEDDDGLPDPVFTGNGMTGRRSGIRRISAVSLAMTDTAIAERTKDEIDRLDLAAEAEDQVTYPDEPEVDLVDE